jgi:hypothetical protein
MGRVLAKMSRPAALLPALILLAVSLASLWPIIGSGDWYSANQAYRYPYLMELFKASFLAGHVYPRWLPELFGGYGYPTFLYYPPGFWFVALPFALILPNVVHAMYFALIALFWLGGLGAYRLARLTLARWPALFCAVLFLSTPYFAVQLYSRGSLAEVAAMLLCPWVFFCLLRLKDALDRRQPATRAAILLAIALGAMVVMHLLITLWLGVSYAVVLAVLFVGRDWPKGFLPALLISALLALALASPYWYPALTLRDAVMFQRGLWVGTPLRFEEFISLRPRMTGLPWTVLALAGLWLGRKARLTQGVALAAAILLFFMLPTSSAIWQASRVLQITQHPGRIFSIFATLELLAIIACVGHLIRQPRFTARQQAVAALLALLLVGASVHDNYRIRDRLDYARFRFDAARSFEDMTHNHELQPRAARIEGLPQRVSAQVPIAQTGDGTRLTIQSRRDDDILVRAEVVSAPASVTLNQFAFPGWRLTLDERRLSPCGQGVTACWQPDEQGRIRILLPAPGSFALHAWFDGPPDWLARTAAAFIASVLGIAALRRLDRLVVRPVPSS